MSPMFQKKTQEGCGGLRGESPGAFPEVGPIFQQPFSLPENAQTLAGIAFRAAGKSVQNFPAASKFAGKLFQQRISDSHSLLEFSSRAAKRGVSNGGVSGSGLVLPFCPFWDFPDFLGFSRFARGFSGIFPDWSLFLSLGLLRAPTRNSPERVRGTIWTFPEKSGKHPGLETPRFSFSQFPNAQIFLAGLGATRQ